MVDIDVPCPECGKDVLVAVEDIARQRTMRCSKGHRFQVKDSDGSAKETDRALKDLDKALKNFGKK